VSLWTMLLVPGMRWQPPGSCRHRSLPASYRCGVALAILQLYLKGVYCWSARDETTGLIALQIAFFNFFGVSVTKKLSGAARATIDATRTLFVWGFSVLMHWERFHALQVSGCQWAYHAPS
jgi:hypothetical protein